MIFYKLLAENTEKKITMYREIVKKTPVVNYYEISLNG
jgi:hypothetical protein